MKYLILMLIVATSSIRASETPVDYEVPDVSIISLIANSKAFQNKIIRIKGYAIITPENCAVYLSKEYAQYFVSENAVWVDFGRDKNDNSDATYEKKLKQLSKFSGKFVSVEGTFYAEKGRWNMFAGQLQDVKISVVDSH